MSGIPCDYTYATIDQMGFDVFDYVDDWYKYNFQEKTYSGSMCTLVTHDVPMIYENGIIRDSLGYTYPFFNPPTTSTFLEDLGNIESSLNSCWKKMVHYIQFNETGHNHATCNNPLP